MTNVCKICGKTIEGKVIYTNDYKKPLKQVFCSSTCKIYWNLYYLTGIDMKE